jgi:hypothetical protein
LVGLHHNKKQKKTEDWWRKTQGLT